MIIIIMTPPRPGSASGAGFSGFRAVGHAQPQMHHAGGRFRHALSKVL